jgi:peptide/nickel transport system substrate-binding protein
VARTPRPRSRVRSLRDRRTRSPRSFLRRVSAAFVLALALAAACALVNTEERPAAGGTYREAVVGQPRSLNPLLHPLDPLTQDVSRLIHAGLVRVVDDGQIRGDLAESWTTSPDGLTYTFKLRQQATWHDGRRVTAADVQATIALLQAPTYAGPPELAALWRGVRAETPDQATIQLTLAQPFTSFVEACSVPILPAHLFGSDGSVDLREHPASYQPVGAGPYALEASNPDSITLSRHERYHGTLPLLDRIELRYYPSGADAVRALASRAVDGFAGASLTELAAADASGTTVVREAPVQGQQLILYLNHANPMLADARVRRAIALAVDRRALVGGPLHEVATPAYGPVPAYSWAYQPSVEFLPDEATARRLLEEAGWVGSPVRSRNGRSLELQLAEAADDRHIAIAELLRRQLEPLGFRIAVQPVDPLDLYRERLLPRSYDMALVNVWLGSVDPDPYPFWHSSQREPGFNFAQYQSPAADAALIAARSNGDPAQRLAALATFQAQWVADTPSIVLASPLLTYAMPTTLRGVRLGVVPEPSARFQHLAEWHLRTTRVPAILP